MRSFFAKKDNNIRLEGSETSMTSEVFTDKLQDIEEGPMVETSLSIHPQWEISKEDQYSLQFLQLECENLEPNQLSIASITIDEKEGGGLDATVFFRQSMNKAIDLGETKLLLLDHMDNVLGRTTIDLTSLGRLPACSSRPWVVPFTKDELYVEDKPENGWKLVFQMNPSARQHTLDIEDHWQKKLQSENINHLHSLIARLEKPKAGEVNFSGLKASVKETGDVQVIILIRNGSNKTVHLEKFPLALEDANGDVLARAFFSPKQLTVKANTSKPWAFIFPKHILKKNQIHLNKWRVFRPKIK
ncbi:accessory Sec system S-layer assembly protein [Geomicrobium halophilum]|uniref:Accessory Sec system S-layer assembly protein n=1 Tax=Geomicrobium halophilum TaxID=549000 RepID=A0A841PT73_9BACL|nr:accessory Sec system S-layer assembly protein [Geomicrobium halophilum]MBB6450386.1 accessory Sec system S-layer assembly protein [Geomicrobium halophilum]